MPVDVGTRTWGPVWTTSRWTTLSALTCVIPVPKGKTRFRIALLFVESFFGKNGARIFGIHINGRVVDMKVDIHKRVGKNKPLYLQFDNIVPVDGKLTISLKSELNNPTLSGIYIEGGSDPFFLPLPQQHCCETKQSMRASKMQDKVYSVYRSTVSRPPPMHFWNNRLFSSGFSATSRSCRRLFKKYEDALPDLEEKREHCCTAK